MKTKQQYPFIVLGSALAPLGHMPFWEAAQRQGFRAGTVMGNNDPKKLKKVRQSQVSFLQAHDKQHKKLFKLVRARAVEASKILGIAIDADAIDQAQASVYKSGDFYGQHQDVDPMRFGMPDDRKLTLIFSLCDFHKVQVANREAILGMGDMIAFASWQNHACPALDADRTSLVVWCPGLTGDSHEPFASGTSRDEEGVSCSSGTRPASLGVDRSSRQGSLHVQAFSDGGFHR